MFIIACKPTPMRKPFLIYTKTVWQFGYVRLDFAGISTDHKKQ